MTSLSLVPLAFAAVAVIGRPRRRLRSRLWRRIRRGLLADGERRRRGALLLLDPVELVNGGGDELLDAGDVVVAICIDTLDRVEPCAHGMQRILGGLRGGGTLPRDRCVVGDERVGPAAGFGGA